MTTTLAGIGVILFLLFATLALVLRESRLRRTSEQRYRQLFSSIDEGFCIIEVIFDGTQRPIDYRFLEINPAFQRQTGLDDALGKRMREIAPKHEEHWFEIYGRIALTGEPARFQNEARQLHRWYDVYAFRFGAPDLRQVAILFNDITERKAAEAELARANRELEAFAYSVSHDLRAPLRSIDGFSQILLEDSADRLTEEGKNHLMRVRRATKTMGELINALLELSRVSRTELKTEKVDLSAMAASIAAELRESKRDRQVEFVIERDLVVEADRRLFRAMLANLLENAWKYSGQRPVARIEFGGTERNAETVYFVRDNGVGFDMAYSDKLFGPFQRLHKETEYAGTGVGLATVQRILNRHGGRAWAEATRDEGATFYFTVGDAVSSHRGDSQSTPQPS
jgi:PAS domain S-box-containing protein